jgi:cytochrome c
MTKRSTPQALPPPASSHIGGELSGINALLALLALGLATLPAAADEFDEAAIVSLLKTSHCFRCHSVEKRKKAPSYKEIAEKYRPRANAEAALLRHITEKPVVKTEDGDEQHAQIKTTDEREMRSVVRWLLAR